MSLLTICIPTYKRLDFLRWTLNRTRADFPDTPIIVSDNDANFEGDFDPWPATEYHRLIENIGPFPNMRFALLKASTKYCCYLGDDDYLLPAEVQKGIEYLEANPEVVAYYAPCQLWNEVEQKPVFEAFYQHDGPVTFNNTPQDRVALWNFVHKQHVWPEHAIYRRAALDKIMDNRGPAYWCFTDLANAIAAGPIHFHDRPYYRNLTDHPVGRRVKLGDEQCLTEFDAYRAGLEVLAFDLFQGIPIPLEVYENINLMIRQFLWTRYEVAGRIAQSKGHMILAEQLYKRCAITARRV
jgi:glycosyltransferase involved in cell wall biosynthesis